MSSLVRKTFPVPPLSCNCSIVGDLETKQAIGVDPGGNPERILDEIESLDLTVCAILHTHAHFDHFLASGYIKLATGAPLCLHPNDKDLWNMLEIQCQMFGVPYSPVPSPDQWIHDEQEMVIGPYTATVLHTPGHTPGSACFYFESQDLVFSGDTLVSRRDRSDRFMGWRWSSDCSIHSRTTVFFEGRNAGHSWSWW